MKPDNPRVRRLLDRIEAAEREEKDWRDECDKIERFYRAEKRASHELGEPNDWNMLAVTTNIMVPAVYNTPPIPDIRRRFTNDQENPVERDAAMVLERAVDIEIEDRTWHEAIKSAVKDMVLYGRGVVRMRYLPEFSPLAEAEGASGDTDEDAGKESPPPAPPPQQEVVWQRCPVRVVPRDDFLRGPGKSWDDVKWIAFRHRVTREEAERMFGDDVGGKLPLKHAVAGSEIKPGDQPPQHMLRAEFWELWDKPTRTVIFVSLDMPHKLLQKPTPDPLHLVGFFPIAEPLYGDTTTGSLVPLTDYRLYEIQAEDLNRVSERITKIVRVIKWRAAYDSNLQGIAALVSAEDGDMEPVQMQGPAASMADGIFMWPIEQAVAVLAQLLAYRAELKTQIYEITGLWDIVRGNTDPDETLGAQKLKLQLGSLRIQERQSEVQRLCRDLIQMQVECISEHYDPQVLSLMTGIEVTPDVQALISSDQLRAWKIDIETDSTIRADMTGARENAAAFVSGVGEFVQAFGPAVQSGMCPPDVAVELLTSFANIFKLGRGADMALSRWSEQVRAMAQQGGQQPQQANPQQQLEEQKMQVEQGRVQLDGRKMELEAQQVEREAQLREAELGLEEMKVVNPQIEAQMQAMVQITQVLQQVAQVLAVTAQAMTAPRVAQIIRDEQGNAIGAQSVVAPQQQMQ